MMKENGTLAKWEKENNVSIETSTTWDEFTYFAGGHGDIVSMSTQETPVLEAETGIKTVTFGKYNYQRVPFFKRKGDPYKTLADIPKGSKICVLGRHRTPRSGACSPRKCTTSTTESVAVISSCWSTTTS